jgi:hypothetical protein
VVAVDRAGEVGAVGDARGGQRGGGLVAERLGDLNQDLDHAGTSAAQRGAHGGELE